MNEKTLFYLVLVLVLSIVISPGTFAYSPEISGNYEVGDRTYIDIFEVDINGEDFAEIDPEDVESEPDRELVEEILDQYCYEKLWLRYKQQLSTSNYYYIKSQYNSKKYREKVNYNNISLDLWTNYTFKINEELRNKVMLDLRNKDYRNNHLNTYNQVRLKYQLDYKVDENNDCSLYLQRQWKDYPDSEDKDNLYDRVSLSWDWDVNDRFTLNTGVQFDWTAFKPISESSDKNSRKFDLGFNWRL